MQGRTRLVGTILIRCKLWIISIATPMFLVYNGPFDVTIIWGPSTQSRFWCLIHMNFEMYLFLSTKGTTITLLHFQTAILQFQHKVANIQNYGPQHLFRNGKQTNHTIALCTKCSDSIPPKIKYRVAATSIHKSNGKINICKIQINQCKIQLLISFCKFHQV